MSKWIAEFELEDGDTMPEHMDLKYKGAKIDFHCRPMWIPVSERLPEVGQAVIVTTKNGYRAVRKCIDAGHLEWFYNDIIAWMPSPEPYQEGEQDG